MEWRCEWCGKPHESDDPPCDNCGHGSYERAVVQRTDLAEGGDPDTMTVWVCTACGREHPKNSPPCSRCNNATLEREEKRVDESNLTERPGSANFDTVSAEQTTVWVCENCGREHTKNAPPCSQCGHAKLEETTRRIDDDELSAPSYRDLATPRYLAVLVVTLVLAAVFVLGATGAVDLPGFPDNSVPGVDNVPGNATTTGEVPLADVETAYLGAVGDRRAGEGLDQLERTGRLDAVARYHNQRWVKAEFGEGSRPTDAELGDLLEDECSGASLVFFSHLATGDDAGPIGDGLADNIASGDPPLLTDVNLTGVDVHSADGRLYLTQFVCT
jgi:ribosomal protein L40E